MGGGAGVGVGRQRLEEPLAYKKKKSFPVFAAGERSGRYLGRQQGESESQEHGGFLQELTLDGAPTVGWAATRAAAVG